MKKSHKWLILLTIFNMILLMTTAYAFPMTSPFGWRYHPISGEQKFHNGIDIGMEEGTPVYALWDGQVIYAAWWDGYGYAVVIDHGNTLYSLYGHNSRLLVVPGQSVSQGETVALSGSTGDSTGPHLHLSVWQNNQYYDPATILQVQQFYLGG